MRDSFPIALAVVAVAVVAAAVIHDLRHVRSQRTLPANRNSWVEVTLAEIRGLPETPERSRA